MKMTMTSERRAHRRLPLRMPLGYRDAQGESGQAMQSMTSNVSTGGVYFETAAEGIKPNDELQIEMQIPSENGRFPANASLKTRGQVVRIDIIDRQNYATLSPYVRYGIGVRFVDDPKLNF